MDEVEKERSRQEATQMVKSKFFHSLCCSIVSILFMATGFISWQGEQTPGRKEGVVRDIIELCETENPKFNPQEECQKIVTTKYPDKKCTITLGAVKWLPMGSCRDCILECR